MTAEQVFGIESLDVIHVCVPPEEHFTLVNRALSAGLNVLCEKPLAANAGEVNDLVELASTRGVIVCPVHQFPFQSGVREVLARKETLGAVMHLNAEMCTAGADHLDDNGRTRVALDIITHPLSLFLRFGVPALSDVRWQVINTQPGEVLVSGASGRVGLSVLISTRGRPTSNVLRVIGSEGTATIDLFHGFASIESGKVSRFRKAARPFVSSALTIGAAASNGIKRALSAETAFPGLQTLVESFYTAVITKGPSPVSGGEVRDVARARDEIISRFQAQS
jgi:predicted dehydrogenase